VALEKFLATGEVALRTEHQHWFVLIANTVSAIVMWLIAVFLLVLSATVFNDNGTIGSLLGWAVVILTIVGLVWFAWKVLVWQNEQFVLTNRRVLRLTGVLNKTVMDSSLEKINDAVLNESIFGRIFGFGDLEIQTASESGIDRLRMLRDAPGFKRAMLDAKHDLELELSGAKPMPAPAYRAPTEPAAPAAAVAPAVPAAPAPAPAAEPTMSADEVTRTLASLADLRDRGAISAEEYEAKKADLLGRL
jgi:PH (Pleckstrin Homology) domain-containing protein/putative oligomerization/nucleic acid binding protein